MAKDSFVSCRSIRLNFCDLVFRDAKTVSRKQYVARARGRHYAIRAMGQNDLSSYKRTCDTYVWIDKGACCLAATAPFHAEVP